MQQRRRVGDLLGCEVDAHERARRVRVVDRVFYVGVRQPASDLRQILPQHRLQSDWCAAVFSPVVLGLDQCAPLGSGHGLPHRGQEFIAASGLAAVEVLGVRETWLNRSHDTVALRH